MSVQFDDFDKCTQLSNHHQKPDIEHSGHSQKFPHNPLFSHWPHPSPWLPLICSVSLCFVFYGILISNITQYVFGLFQFGFEIYPCCPVYQKFIPFYSWVVFHYKDMPETDIWIVSSFLLLYIMLLWTLRTSLSWTCVCCFWLSK